MAEDHGEDPMNEENSMKEEPVLRPYRLGRGQKPKPSFGGRPSVRAMS
jgi:hypothetical protein